MVAFIVAYFNKVVLLSAAVVSLTCTFIQC